MKNLIYILLLFISACTEDIELNLKHTDPRLVVEGFITTDTATHYVRLSKSGDFFANEQMPAVRHAKVSINDGHYTYELIESESLPGLYLTFDNFFGVTGRTYKLKIENVDINDDGVYETYTAQSYLNPVTKVDSIKLEYEDNWDLWKVLLYAMEPGGDTTDYYMFSLIVNDTLYTDQLTEVTVADDRFIDGNYAKGVWVHSFYINNDEYDIYPGDTITLKMSGITSEFYNYVIALQEETGTNIPLFSGPPANLPGNISNGALGYFTCYSNSYGSTIHTGDKTDIQ
ncbi:MAG: DUF4249 domain-containing protein [Chlorobi bacterium]|nr:DUF4249 domain-containing protein [Chlorobiota bacterium]